MQASIDIFNIHQRIMDDYKHFVSSFINMARQENLWVNCGSGNLPIVRNSAILRTS